MKILLLGKNGQVGWELQRALAPLGKLIALGRDECDLANPAQLRQVLETTQPAIIVNAAAYTAVDRAEQEIPAAYAINAKAPGILAAEAARSGAWLVHYSTDYVFDGSGEKPWREADSAHPLSAYGASKLAGEQAIQNHDCPHLIFRTSWVYGARGHNFAKTMLRLAQDRDQLRIIADQFGAPTGAELLADVTAHALRVARQQPEVSGIYHLVADGETSWHGYARFVLETASRLGVALKTPAEAVQPIPTSDYPTPAKRPLNSRLDTGKLREAFDLHLPPWQTGVARMLEEICQEV